MRATDAIVLGPVLFYLLLFLAFPAAGGAGTFFGVSTAECFRESLQGRLILLRYRAKVGLSSVVIVLRFVGAHPETTAGWIVSGMLAAFWHATLSGIAWNTAGGEVPVVSEPGPVATANSRGFHASLAALPAGVLSLLACAWIVLSMHAGELPGHRQIRWGFGVVTECPEGIACWAAPLAAALLCSAVFTLLRILNFDRSWRGAEYAVAIYAVGLTFGLHAIQPFEAPQKVGFAVLFVLMEAQIFLSMWFFGQHQRLP